MSIYLSNILDYMQSRIYYPVVGPLLQQIYIYLCVMVRNDYQGT